MLEQALEQAGVRTHIDDFGTGASPLRLLHRFPGDAIKVSRALVAGIGHDAGAFEIVRAVVGLAHNLGLEVIADGVEQREQLDYLKVLGCEFAQGFHISAPLSAAEARGAARDRCRARALAALRRRRCARRRRRHASALVAVEARRAVGLVDRLVAAAASASSAVVDAVAVGIVTAVVIDS